MAHQQPNPGFFSVPDFLRHYREAQNAQQRAGPSSMPIESQATSSSTSTEPTHFGKTVTNALAAMTKKGAIDQRLIRYYLTMAASFLITDTTMNPDGGLNSWSQGFLQLVNVLVALHNRSELELETVNEASKACSECWNVSGSWKGLENGRDTVREVAGKLKSLLDPNGHTFQGQPIYTPQA